MRYEDDTSKLLPVVEFSLKEAAAILCIAVELLK